VKRVLAKGNFSFRINRFAVPYTVSIIFQEGLDVPDLEPVDLLSENFGDTGGKEGPGRDDFMGDDDGETQIFKQAVQHSKPGLTQSPKDEL